MFHIRCFVHSLQLEVNNYLECVDVQAVVATAASRPEFKTPCLTRWWSTFDSVEAVKKAGLETGMDATEYAEIDKFVKQITPIRVAGREMEMDSCTVPQALYTWWGIRNSLDDVFRLSLDCRMLKMCDDVHFLSAFLSPLCNFKREQTPNVMYVADVTWKSWSLSAGNWQDS